MYIIIIISILSSISQIIIFYCYKKYYEIQSPNIYYDENRIFYKPLIDEEAQ